MRFVDTSVLLYAISRDPAEQQKAARANTLLGSRDLGLSVQVLQEFYVEVTRESRTDRLTYEQATALVDAFRRFPVQDMTVGVSLAAMSTGQRFHVSYRDATVIEAARALGCDFVLTEDLSDGGEYAGIRVTNPFSGM